MGTDLCWWNYSPERSGKREEDALGGRSNPCRASVNPCRAPQWNSDTVWRVGHGHRDGPLSGKELHSKSPHVAEHVPDHAGAMPVWVAANRGQN